MIRTYKYRLHPNQFQTEMMDTLFWQTCTLYNAVLAQYITVHKETGKGIDFADQCKVFRDERNHSPESYSSLNLTSVQQMLRRLDKTYSAFFSRIKADKTSVFQRVKVYDRFKNVQ